MKKGELPPTPIGDFLVKIIRLPFALVFYPFVFAAGLLIGDNPEKVRATLSDMIWPNY